jgi:hypothetical protein
MPFAFLVPKYFSIICTNRKDARFTKFGKETFEETKGIIRNRKLKKDRQYNGQKTRDKQCSTKHDTENE